MTQPAPGSRRGQVRDQKSVEALAALGTLGALGERLAGRLEARLAAGLEVRLGLERLLGARPLGEAAFGTLKALALGAQAVLMARPFVVAIYGDGKQGAKDYLAQLADELRDTMEMCGAATIRDIDEDMLAW